MKTTIKILSISLLLICTLFADAQDSTMYKLKLEKSVSMQETGTLLMGGGFLLLMGSGFVYQFVEPLPDGINDNYIIKDIEIGIICVAGALIVPGLIVNRVGKHREKEYQIKLDRSRSGFYCNPNQVGLKLAFTF